jgi:tetratricopeptide (TPR) repeat protein
VATVVVLGFAPQTIRRVPVWRSEIRLFTTTVNDTPPGVMRPRMNLLATLVNTHDPDRILDYTEKLQAEINRLNLEVSPRNRAEILRHRGFAFLMQEQTELGIKNLRMAQQTDPLYEQIYLDLGILDGKRGQHQAALEFFQKGLLLSPSHVNLLYSQGIALQELGKPSEAEKSFRKAIHFGYDKPDAHRSLAALLWSQNRIPEASGIYKDALKIWPEDQDIHYWYQRSLKSPPTP